MGENENFLIGRFRRLSPVRRGLLTCWRCLRKRNPEVVPFSEPYHIIRS